MVPHGLLLKKKKEEEKEEPLKRNEEIKRKGRVTNGRTNYTPSSVRDTQTGK